MGGLGTLIASLASLISFQAFTRAYPGRQGAFLKVFTLWNAAFLLVLGAEALIAVIFFAILRAIARRQAKKLAAKIRRHLRTKTILRAF